MALMIFISVIHKIIEYVRRAVWTEIDCDIKTKNFVNSVDICRRLCYNGNNLYARVCFHAGIPFFIERYAIFIAIFYTEIQNVDHRKFF